MKDKDTRIKPFIIGLTGAIGTGKSLVRKMLEHKGALTIDADRLAHGAYAAGTKGYNELVRVFGNEVLDQEKQIDRKRLGEMVFKNSQALHQLESLIHPLVIEAIERVTRLSPLPIIVIEAIKLLQSELYKQCDIIWEVTSHPEDIYWRLSRSRGMSQAHVDERLSHQYLQKSDKSLIETTILNQADIKTLWKNVSAIWDDLALKSVFFRHALSETIRLMQPFQENLIRQYSDRHAQTLTEINKRGMFFVPVKNLGCMDSFFDGESFDPVNLKNNSMPFLFWSSEENLEKALLFISDIDNFSATAAACTDRFEKDEFIRLFGIMQGYLHLHLCEILYFPFNNNTAPLSEALGFGQSNASDLSESGLSTLGYNLLYKKLRPPLDLFREK